MPDSVSAPAVAIAAPLTPNPLVMGRPKINIGSAIKLLKLVNNDTFRGVTVSSIPR